MRHHRLTLSAVAVLVLGATAAAQPVAPACVKALDGPALAALIGAPGLREAPIIFKDPADRLICSVLGRGTDVVTLYLRTDAGGGGELRTRRTLHQGAMEPLAGLGEQAFYFLVRADRPGEQGVGIVAHRNGVTCVIDGVSVPQARVNDAKAYLAARARAALGP